jgi:hypothetical protein
MKKIGNMRIFVSVCLFICLLTWPFVVGAFDHGRGGHLSIDKTYYAPGEEIQVNFRADRDWPRNAWIGIMPSNIQHGSEAINDQNDITYQYIEKRTQGVMVFKAPGPGQWDLRMNDNDNNGREVAYVSFNVGDAIPTGHNTKLRLEKTAFAPGEDIRLNFHADPDWPRNAWIGIIPSNIQHGSEAINDQNDITYQYIEKRTQGVMVFKAPGPGQWDLRMNDNDNNGREVAYVSFNVGDAVPTGYESNDANLRLEKTAFAPGEEIRLSFRADPNWPRDAWIGIIPSNIQHGSEATNDQNDITYQYIEKRAQGVMVFKAPGPGQWDLRMHDTDSNGKEMSYISFTVR